MKVKEAIQKRRAYRALAPIEITEEMIQELAGAIQLAPSCFNMQPWRFVFVKEPDILKKIHGALSQGNEWAQRASMIIAVFSEKESDCVIREREYYLFDTGMATAFLILRAMELDLVAHPIAGFSPKKVKEILEIPEDKLIIALIVIGKHSDDTGLMNDKQIEIEKKRPERKSVDEFIFMDKYLDSSKIEK